jgi:hypothetical protein
MSFVGRIGIYFDVFSGTAGIEHSNAESGTKNQSNSATLCWKSGFYLFWNI